MHRDGKAYRLAAVRETFEETGILLARRKGEKGLLEVESEEVARERKRVHKSEVKFTDWLESKDAAADTGKSSSRCFHVPCKAED